MALPPQQRDALRAAKLTALVTGRQATGVSSSAQRGTLPGGAYVLDHGTAWVLGEERPDRILGPALAWAQSQQVPSTALNLVVDDHAGLLARRAAAFREPPAVWLVDGGELVAVEPDPPSSGASAPVGAEARALVELIDAAGADVVIDHGEIIGEVLGLEVARVVVDDGGSARLEVGVGRNDREAFAIVHADRDPFDALSSVVGTVRTHRQAGAPAHPLNRLGAPRWLRSRLVADPGLVGASRLVAVPGVLPRGGVKESVPVAAVGSDDQGRTVVVVASVGIDLDLVPTAADLRLAHAPGARLVLVVPERDAHPATRRMAAGLIDPAEVVTVSDDWR